MIVAGFGFRAAACADSLRDAYDRARGDRRADAVATAAEKADAAALQSLAADLSLPVLTVARAGLSRQDTPTRSPASLSAYGTGSVAEAAALACAGPGARLIARRTISADRHATCALAVSAAP